MLPTSILLNHFYYIVIFFYINIEIFSIFWVLTKISFHHQNYCLSGGCYKFRSSFSNNCHREFYEDLYFYQPILILHQKYIINNFSNQFFIANRTFLNYYKDFDQFSNPFNTNKKHNFDILKILY